MVSERIKSVKRNVVQKGMNLKRYARTPGPTPGVPYDVPRTSRYVPLPEITIFEKSKFYLLFAKKYEF